MSIETRSPQAGQAALGDGLGDEKSARGTRKAAWG